MVILSNKWIVTQMNVPRIIHQIWMQGSDVVPEKYAQHRESWRKINPTWKVVTWGEDDIIKLIDLKYPSWKVCYSGCKKLIQRADIARCFILHAFGGVYVDMDAQALAPIDIIFSSSHAPLVLLGFMGRHILNNAFIASSKLNPFWTECFFPEVCKRQKSVPFWVSVGKKLSVGLEVSYTTGPFVWKSLYNEHKGNSKYGLKTVEPHVLYPQMRSGESFLTEKDAAVVVRAGGIMYHKFDSEWLNGRWERVAFKLVTHDKHKPVFIAILVLLILIPSIIVVSKQRRLGWRQKS